MEFYIGIILVVIFIETTILVLKNNDRILVGGGRRRVFVDTSSLIDGRILAVAHTGFIGDELVVSRSVLSELQLLADGSDSDKRARARYGLDVVAELQKISGLKVTIWRDEPFVSEGVDNRLIKLAKKHGGLIMTNDFNLNKVAVVEGITVLNINDLAQSLRSAFLPGESLELELVQKGSEAGQAIGYLPDGTMVVVEDASGGIGKSVRVEFIRYLQTSAGKMMFAKVLGSRAKRTSPDAGPSAESRPAQKPPREQQSVQKPARTPRQPKSRSSNSSNSESTSKPSGRPGKRTRQAESSASEGGSKRSSEQQRRPRRRETNEDRLVQLANRK
jgi:rRNA-processing protein FCF1